MTEQQQHLASLAQQRDTLAEQLESLKTNASNTRDLLLRVQGAIEYLTQIGVSLPEPETTESSETEETETEAEAE